MLVKYYKMIFYFFMRISLPTIKKKKKTFTIKTSIDMKFKHIIYSGFKSDTWGGKTLEIAEKITLATWRACNPPLAK